MKNKQCLHKFEWTFVVDCADLTCKKCGKDVFEIYSKEDALLIIKEHEPAHSNNRN